MCLQRVADIINSSVGESGYTARYGAKEFAVLLPATTFSLPEIWWNPLQNRYML